MRLVATDLDGTLLRGDHSVSQRTVAALAACQARGVHVVFVTGRPLRWMPAVVEATGHAGLALCSNGAALVHLGRGEVVSSRPFEVADVHRTVAALRESMDDVWFGFETATGPLWETGYPGQENLDPPPPRGSVEELMADEPQVLKILCRSPSQRADAMLAQARAVLTDLAEPVHSNPADHLLEISVAGVTKAWALAQFADSLGVPQAEVVAFGDMPNDVDMLRWAGTGYAMADGHPEALAAADAIAPPCDEDGVAQVLEQLLSQTGQPQTGESAATRPISVK